MILSMFDEFAWAVGIFEGEGSIISKRPKGYTSTVRCLTMCSTDEDTAMRFYHAVDDVGSVYRRDRRGCKPLWTWKLTGWEAVSTLAIRMYPYLNRRRQIAVVRLLFNPPTQPDRRLSGSTCAVGHDLSGDGIMYLADGSRRCRQCRRASKDRANAARGC